MGILSKALEVIRDPKNWGKGNQHKVVGIDGVKHCSIGALETAGCSFEEMARLFEQLSRVAEELFPGRGYNNIIAFNDHKDTTHEDVVLVFKHAIDIYES